MSMKRQSACVDAAAGRLSRPARNAHRCATLDGIAACLWDFNSETQRSGFPATVLHPGHIVGRGWVPLNPAGNFDPQVFVTLARGGELRLPNLGLETMHHVHADDVAQAFMQSLDNWSQAVGESFHVVSPAALSMRGYAESVAAWFGKRAQLRFLPWEEWK
jgi:nucleoside-diphosphate-sugar epimerase